MPGEEGKDKVETAGDLSELADLFWAAADIYHIEKHISNTIFCVKTEMPDGTEKDGLIEKLMEIYDDIRVIRTKTLTSGLVTGTAYDFYCPFKHFLGIMEFMEVATKHWHAGHKEKALEMVDLAYKLWVLFWYYREVAKSLKTSGKPAHPKRG